MFPDVFMDPSEIVFEWDDRKERLNFQKHGIRFKTAVKVFFDPCALYYEDNTHAKEPRIQVIGKAGKILFVVCACKEPDVIRLISARIATNTERQRYEYDKDQNE